MNCQRLVLFSFLCCVPFILAFAPHEDESAPDSSINAAAAGIGEGGPFYSRNIEILGHLTLSQMGGGPANIKGNDCWGWTDSQTNKEYAIVGLMHTTSFVDISDPLNPAYLGQLPTQTGVSTWRDIKVYEDHAFIVSDSNDQHGMQVFDLTQLRNVNPANPQVFSNTAHYDGVNSSHNIVINEETGYAYIVGSNRASGGLHVVNIQDPTNPVQAGNYGDDGYTHDAQVVSYIGPDPDYAGREIAFCCNGRSGSDNDTLGIVDVTDKSNMVGISNSNYQDPGYSHQGWLSDDHRYFFHGDEFDEAIFSGGTRVLVWDCQDLDNPVLLGFAEGATGAIDHNMYFHEGRLYASNYAAGLRVYDFDPANPLNLEEIAWVDTYPTDDDTDFDGVWSNYPYFESGVVAVNDRQNGLFVVRLTTLEFDFPGGLPDLVDPDGEFEFEFVVSEFNGGVPAAASGTLHVDRGNGFETFPLNEVSANTYEAVFPEMQCGEVVKYFVSAMTTDGTMVCNPPNAPAISYTATVADSISTPFEDDFETDQGWSVSGDAETGHWERGVPADNGESGDPTMDADGSGQCYLTENAEGNTDVDEGTTILTSPTMDAVGNGTAVASFIQYYRWYSNDRGNAPASDIFVVEISNDDGQNWTELETVGPDGNEVSGGWFYKSFEISDFVAPTNQMRIRFIASDLGEASLVEAGVDGVNIMLVECEEQGILLGDVNQDGVVDFLDIAPFVDLLNTGGYLEEADMNQDGVVDFLDIELFVEALS